MPGKDGRGPMTRRAHGFKGGFCRGLCCNTSSSKSEKELLNGKKAMLEERLECVNKQLESL